MHYRFINAFETPSEVILVMEYLDGGELFERVAADDFNLTESDCCLFMRQICRGVQYLHNHNIVHLDLKVGFSWILQFFCEITSRGSNRTCVGYTTKAIASF